jgi:hypothetical protein
VGTRVRLRAVVVGLLATLLCGACVSTTVDGFALGSIVKCSGGITPVPSTAPANACHGGRELATQLLDAREPGHPPVASVEMYADGTQPGPIDVTGDGPPPTPASRHPGPMVTVFLFTLTDGSRRATGLACEPGGGPPCVGIGSYPH